MFHKVVYSHTNSGERLECCCIKGQLRKISAKKIVKLGNFYWRCGKIYGFLLS